VARKSANYTTGADGEESLAQAIAPLAAQGWLALPDRRTPNGGNLDEIIVGPPGVAVIDAKNWSYSVELKDDRIYTGRFRRTSALDSISGQVEVVQAAVADLAYAVPVRGFLALAGARDRSRIAEEVRNIRIVGVDQIKDKLSQAKVQLDTAQVEEVFRILSLAFPPHSFSKTSGLAEASNPTPREKPHKLFDRNVRFFYIRSWSRSGKSRLYLKSSDGTELGWKNVHTGEIELYGDGDDARLARAVLESASPTRVTLAAANLPKVALAIPGGRLLAQFASLRAMVLVGQEWTTKGTRRLYGTLISPGYGTFILGHADLRTGELHPSVDGDVARDHASAERYLQLLFERRPGSNSANSS
jgi:hypothetical protein